MSCGAMNHCLNRGLLVGDDGAVVSLVESIKNNVPDPDPDLHLTGEE